MNSHGEMNEWNVAEFAPEIPREVTVRENFLRTHFELLVKARFTLHLIILCSVRFVAARHVARKHFFHHRHRGIRRQKKTQPRMENLF